MAKVWASRYPGCRLRNNVLTCYSALHWRAKFEYAESEAEHQTLKEIKRFSEDKNS